MYNVSNRYLNAWLQYSRSYDFDGTIGSVGYTGDNILKGSLTILQQCSDKNEVQIGSVFTSEFHATFRNINIPRRSWVGKEITLNEGLSIDVGSGVYEYEYVPVGRYTISEAQHTQSGMVVTAYDNMVKFDKGFKMKTLSGKPFNILKIICTNCGVTLGMTESQVMAFPNGTRVLTLYSENDIETYRDLLSWIAQTLGAFAYIDREGKLKLFAYKNTVNYDWPLDRDTRFQGGAVSDFETFYTGVSLVNIKEETTEYYHITPDNGLTYNLGSNPFLQEQNGLVREEMVTGVLNNLSNIHYTPFEFSGHFGALFDLGDILSFVDGIGANSIGCITAIDYKAGDTVRLYGYGSDPKLATAKSKTDKNISGLVNKTKTDSVYFYNFLNVDGYTVGSTMQNIASIVYATAKACDVVFQGEVLCNVTAGTVVEVTYLIDGTAESYHPVETWSEAGKHILSLMYYMANGVNEGHVFTVAMKCLQGSMTIEPNEARFMIWGQGLAAQKDWNGRITLRENIGLIDINDSIGMEDFDYSLSAVAQVPIGITHTEQMSLIDIDDSIEVEDFSAVLYMNKKSVHDETWGEIAEKTWANLYDEYLW